MFLKISSIYLTILVIWRSTLVTADPLQSRAVQNFGVNCQLNRFASNEFDLGISYLNASIYMSGDRVALHGFGRMFKKFWLDQLENTNKILGYIVKRGGVVETPGVKPQFFNNLNSVDFFKNESILIYKFLEDTKELNWRLLELHNSTSRNNAIETECIKKYGNRRTSEYTMTQIMDPYTANFLDENLVTKKVEQIKFLADLFRRINRFDQHPKNVEGVTHFLNPLGVHKLDQELLETFSS